MTTKTEMFEAIKRISDFAYDNLPEDVHFTMLGVVLGTKDVAVFSTHTDRSFVKQVLTEAANSYTKEGSKE